MDQRDIMGGEIWKRAIEQGIHHSPIFIACLSQHSVRKRGVIQKEIKQALEIAEGMLPEDISIIPLRLEECEMPERLKDFQAVDFYEPDGWERLLTALQEAIERRK